jgi:hypothetical protein
METTVVRYKVKADRAEENRDYIRRVFAQLDEDKPDGLRYVSFNLDDGLTFVRLFKILSPASRIAATSRRSRPGRTLSGLIACSGSGSWSLRPVQ